MFVPQAHAQTVTAETFPALLQRATDAFAGGDYAAALYWFDRIEQVYGDEPELSKPDARRRLLPLHGFSALQSGQWEQAVALLERSLEEPNLSHSLRGSVLFFLGHAYHRNHAFEKAMESFLAFEELVPGRFETLLSHIKRGEILLDAGRFEDAKALLVAFSESDAPVSLRQEARLRLLQNTVQTQPVDVAASLLIGFPWSLHHMPEIAVLSFAALETAERLQSNGKHTEAISAFRHVFPYKSLLEAQEERLDEWRRRQAAALRRGTANAMTARYFSEISRRLEFQLKRLKDMEDYTPVYLMRLGQSLLLEHRYFEAWLCFEKLALDETLSPNLREEAHFRWILASNGIESWEESLSIARAFVREHPRSQLAPQAFSLIAQAHQEQRRFPEAIEVFDDLIARFSDHALHTRWIFTRGFNRAMLDEHSAARDDFIRFKEEFRNDPLAVNAMLWHALTHSFERNYEAARSELTALEQGYRHHNLYPEIVYRLAAVHYAVRDYTTGLKQVTRFVDSYPLHPRHAEGLVLQGDIRMAVGELSAAIQSFRKIPRELTSLHAYGVFQVGKIFQARQEYDRMISHFSSYVDEQTGELPLRFSEALYWIAWAHEQKGEIADAIRLYVGALADHGNDPAATEMHSVLQSLARLANLTEATVSQHMSFEDWLTKERTHALESDALTYYSRLTLFHADRKVRTGGENEEENILLELDQKVPLEALDATLLGRIGNAFLDRDTDTAQAYLLRLLSFAPASPARAYAYHGLGHLAMETENWGKALEWLDRFHNETPQHPLGPETALMRGRALKKLGRVADAVAQYDALLRLRAARGRYHARALLGLAAVYVENAEYSKAIACHQRVYTLYRAHRDLVADAYFQSGLLFEQLGDPDAAYRTFTEFINDDSLAGEPAFELARMERARLKKILSGNGIISPEEGDVL